MVPPTRPPANAFVAFSRRIYNPLGFTKGYNFAYWLLTCGSLFAFALSRMFYLDYFRYKCPDDDPAIGECYYFGRNGPASQRISMILHLATVLPASLLVVLQFVPAIRHRWILVHRLNGYAVLLLYIPAAVTGLLMRKTAFGGDQTIRLGVVLLFSWTIACMALGYYNIKRLQIEQHRQWMMRCWTSAASIITSRLIQVIMARNASAEGDVYMVRSCAQIDNMLGRNRTLTFYPGAAGCEPFYTGQNPDAQVAVKAAWGGRQGALGIAAALGSSFGPCLFAAFLLHLLLTEIYLHLTPVEHERLRNVSFLRQQEAGMRHPGRAGLTADRLGDAPRWVPTTTATQATAPADSVDEDSQLKKVATTTQAVQGPEARPRSAQSSVEAQHQSRPDGENKKEEGA